jgi:hypothetical protein
MPKVVFAHELPACECCGEPWCPVHAEHYADCPCVGPDSQPMNITLETVSRHPPEAETNCIHAQRLYETRLTHLGACFVRVLIEGECRHVIQFDDAGTPSVSTPPPPDRPA